MNPLITSAINQLTIPIPNNSIHIYYDNEADARQESFRTCQPFFISVINGVRVYSVRCKV